MKSRAFFLIAMLLLAWETGVVAQPMLRTVRTKRTAAAELLKDGKPVGRAFVPLGTALVLRGVDETNLIVDFGKERARVPIDATDFRPAHGFPHFMELNSMTGKRYSNVFIIGLTPATLTIKHKQGMDVIPLAELDEQHQAMFNYDAEARRAYVGKERSGAAGTSVPDARIDPPLPGGGAADQPAELLSFLDEKMHRGLVARWSAQLLDVTVEPTFLDAKSRDYGKGAIPGAPFAEVPAGYLAFSSGYRDSVGGMVDLPVPLAGRTRAYVYTRDFAGIGSPHAWRQWWSGSGSDDLSDLPEVRDVPSPRDGVTPTERTELLDPFNRRSVILSNAGNVIEEGYHMRFRGESRRSDVSIIRTAKGCFLGILREKPADGARPELPWEQALAVTDGRFRLVLEKKVPVTKNTPLFALADFTAIRREMTPMMDPEEARVVPRHFPALLEFGAAGLAAELGVRSGGAVKMLTPPPPALAGGPQAKPVERQTFVEMIDLRFLDYAKDRTLIEVRVTQSEREIRRSDSARERPSAQSWKSVKRSENRWLHNEVDGTLRLTDGRRIYEIRPTGFFDKVELRTYRIEPNELRAR